MDSLFDTIRGKLTHDKEEQEEEEQESLIASTVALTV